jgi:hypothetical protein
MSIHLFKESTPADTTGSSRLISDDGPDREVETSDRRTFIMGKSSAETFSYLSAIQGKNGVIHLISDKNHYSFNLAWLKMPSPALP